MARTFDGTDDQIAFGSEAAIDNLGPWTAVALIRPTASITTERQILTKFTSGYNGSMFLAATATNRIMSLHTGSVTSYAETANNVLTADIWKVVIASWGATIAIPTTHLIRVFACTLGGTMAEASYTTQTLGTGLTGDLAATLRIGARDPLDATFFAGGLAESALWNRELTADERHALGRGYTPEFFPRGRVMYSKVDGRHSPEINYAGTTHGTVTGTTYLDHPPVIVPSHSRFRFTPVPAAGSFQVAWAAGRNTVLMPGAP